MRKEWKKRIIAGAVIMALTPVNAFQVWAEPAPDGMTKAETTEAAANGNWENWKAEWENIKNDWTQMSLTPGKNAGELNFAWYSKAEEAVPMLKIGIGAEMKDAVEYKASQTAATEAEDGTAYKSNKVTVSGLQENTTYYYCYQVNGVYGEPVEYKTKDTDNFSFIYVGDPQIGSSNEKKSAGKDSPEALAAFLNAQSEAVRNDAFNWNHTLEAAMEKTDNQAGFVLSAGDQIQLTKKKSPDKAAYSSEIEYAGYLSPKVLKALPVATTVGNHDADNPNYLYHFNIPNLSELGSNGIVGGDYYFTYGSALFLMLNTQDTNVAEHKAFIEQAVKENPDCKWRIVTLHQDIYGSAEHSNEPEITNLRYSLVPYFEENDIDVVLTGHDHAYSRSKILKGGRKTTDYTDDEFDEQLDLDMDAGENPGTLYTAPGNITPETPSKAGQAYLNYLSAVMDKDAIENVTTEGETVINPDGILYMTANSSSGSKYYDLVPRVQTYIAGRWQEDVPTYSIIDVTDTTFTINTYRTDNNEKIDTTFTIAKTKTPAQPTVKPTNAPTAVPTQEAVSVSKAKVKAVGNKTYTGKAIKPSLTVKYNDTVLKKGTDYTVSYKDNKYTGLAKAVIKGIGKYNGTKTVTFKIVPKKVSLSKAKSKKAGSIFVSYRKLNGKISGYEITYAKNKKFKSAKKKTTAKTGYTIKSLSKGKYYVKVRAYKKISGKRVYGAYSKTIKVTVK